MDLVLVVMDSMLGSAAKELRLGFRADALTKIKPWARSVATFVVRTSLNDK